MKHVSETARQQIADVLRHSADIAVEFGEFSCHPSDPFQVEIPANPQNGDFSANVALLWARALHQSPRKIADILLRHIKTEDTYIQRFEAAGPGFLNFFLGPSYYADALLDILNNGDVYGRSSLGESKRILVEFVSANPTGPMHMGNARGGALGDCLAAILETAGYYVEREFYVNDTGNQIAKFALSLDIRYQQLYLGEDAIPLPEDSYHGDDILQHAKEFAALHGDQYLYASEQERRNALVSYALPQNISSMQKAMDHYRIAYDTWFHESSLYENGEVDRVVELLRQSDFTYEKDGALWFEAGDFGCDKDFVLLRSNGLPTYIVPDIAYHYNKLVTRGFDRAINILGADHHGYTMRLRAVLTALGIDASRLDFVLMQLVRFTQNGEVVRMSKRTGKAVTLVDLLEEIPIDAVRFLFNMREANTPMDFDFDAAVQQTAQNPVYYCQYAHARICSILRKLEEEGISPRPCSKEELMLLSQKEELELIQQLTLLPDEIIAAAKGYDPTKVTRYCVDVTSLFHKFYNAHRVNCDEDSLRQARLALCICVRNTLANILRMFKISAPERM
ncbi:MAG: arginine--tRNA ligase [Oscillospiraceae bacterium]|jgi:arginyl-tRNA synthetase|nr:arginine--tRNA ligase [Oscillospiraceae bacterium]